MDMEPKSNPKKRLSATETNHADTILHRDADMEPPVSKRPLLNQHTLELSTLMLQLLQLLDTSSKSSTILTMSIASILATLVETQNINLLKHLLVHPQICQTFRFIPNKSEWPFQKTLILACQQPYNETLKSIIVMLLEHAQPCFIDEKALIHMAAQYGQIELLKLFFTRFDIMHFEGALDSIFDASCYTRSAGTFDNDIGPQFTNKNQFVKVCQYLVTNARCKPSMSHVLNLIEYLEDTIDVHLDAIYLFVKTLFDQEFMTVLMKHEMITVAIEAGRVQLVKHFLKSKPWQVFGFAMPDFQHTYANMYAHPVYSLIRSGKTNTIPSFKKLGLVIADDYWSEFSLDWCKSTLPTSSVNYVKRMKKTCP